MKSISTYLFLIGLFLTLGFSGCINDDDLDFPDDRSDEVISTIEVLTLLNAFELTDDFFGCFQPIFPLELAYNTGVIVTAEDLDGLLEVVDNQTGDFYIEGIVLPVLVDKGGLLSSVDDIADLKALVDECQFPQLTSLIRAGEDQCFEFIYPFSVIADGNTLIIESDDEYDELEELLERDIDVKFTFPLEIEKFSTDSDVEVNNYYELLRLVSDCKPCPDGDIKVIPEFDGLHTFVAQFDDLVHPISYAWYLDGEIIGDGNTDSRDSLTVQLPNDEYEICLKSFGPDCVEGLETCRELIVDRPCPEVFFTTDESLDNSKLLFFYADASLLEDYSFEWSVYLNEDLIYEEEEVPGKGDGKLIFEFETGFYTVCLEKEEEVTNCEVTEYCKEFFFQ